MNLINCSEKCIHQADGYCTLGGVASITNTKGTHCAYYDNGSRSALKGRDRLPQVANPDHLEPLQSGKIEL